MTNSLDIAPSKAVRTRIAPSPTGLPHLGTAYMALFNYCFARAHGGQFLLRFEDTDQSRSSRFAEQEIIEALQWLGLQWDEGPDTGGSCGPYRQSERQSIYRRYAQQLVDTGHAFHCFATPEELEEMRGEQLRRGETTRYDGRRKKLHPDEVKRRIAAGRRPVVRLDVPDSGSCTLNDQLRGKITVQWSQVDMQVLLKSDGMPTYHLASVVDDHLMGITHVIRGEEWINSMPKHQLLYRALGWEEPLYYHLPLLRNADQSKISKRKNPTGILYYRRIGILPEALLNYLARMGWSMPDERERFSLDEMVEHFDIGRISLGGPIFDRQKLNWLNGEWIRGQDDESLLQRLREWFNSIATPQALLSPVKKRMQSFSDLEPLAGFLLRVSLDLKPEDFSAYKLSLEKQKEILQQLLWQLEAQRENWEQDALFATIKALAEQRQLKLRNVLAPVFIAITGSSASFSVTEAMALLGPDLTVNRLRQAIAVLDEFLARELEALKKGDEIIPAIYSTLKQHHRSWRLSSIQRAAEDQAQVFILDTTSMTMLTAAPDSSPTALSALALKYRSEPLDASWGDADLRLHPTVVNAIAS